MFPLADYEYHLTNKETTWRYLVGGRSHSATGDRMARSITTLVLYRLRDARGDAHTTGLIRFVQALQRDFGRPLKELPLSALSRILARLTTQIEQPLPARWLDWQTDDDA